MATSTFNNTTNQNFDIDAMRLPPNYAATLDVKKILTTVSVGKPDKSRFFQIRDDDSWVFRAFILTMKESNETYLVMPEIAPMFGSLVRPAELYAAIDRYGNPSLVPVFLPGEDGKRNPWHESFAQAVEIAKSKWIRIDANMRVGGYDVLQAQGELSDPVWPDTNMEELIRVGFRNKIIDREDHPIIQTLQGFV